MGHTPIEGKKLPPPVLGVPLPPHQAGEENPERRSGRLYPRSLQIRTTLAATGFPGVYLEKPKQGQRLVVWDRVSFVNETWP